MDGILKTTISNLFFGMKNFELLAPWTLLSGIVPTNDDPLLCIAELKCVNTKVPIIMIEYQNAHIYDSNGASVSAGTVLISKWDMFVKVCLRFNDLE